MGNILDAGVGIVQSLPIVIRAMEKCNKETLIIIEEPETHLHPAAHANLGELVCDSVKNDPFKKYLIETHSLNFIMRLRRLIAEGRLEKEKVSLYVSDRLTPSINFQYAFLSLPAKRILWYIGH